MSSYNVVSTTGDENPAAPATFVDLSKNMEQELEKRRQDWEKEVSKMQQDFFKVKVSEPKQDPREGKTKTVELLHDVNTPRRGRSGTEIFDISHAKTLYSEKPDGSQVFKWRFDVKGYEPHEIKIKAEGSKLCVSAQTEEEQQSGNKAMKQFNRQVDIPHNVDPDMIVSFLSADGILSVEAPVEHQEEEEGDYREQEVIEITPSMLAPPIIDPPNYQTVMTGHVRNISPTTREYHSKRIVGSSSPIIYQGSHHYGSSPIPDTGISYNVTRIHSGPHHTCHAGSPRRPMKTHPNKNSLHGSHVEYRRSVSPHTGTTVVEYSNKPSFGSRFGSSALGSSHLTNSGLTSHIDQFRYNDPTILTSDEGKRMKMVVDVGKDYTNEDVHVTIHGTKIKVHARREETVAGRTSKREFSREFFSPEEIDGDTARVVLGNDGKLTIGACVQGNQYQSSVLQLVACDMPMHGKSCHLHLE